MSTFALIHGAGDVAWSWGPVAAELRERGHQTVAVELPCDDDGAGLGDYAYAVVEAVAGADDLVVVAHSLGGFTAPLVADRIPVELLVLVAAMIPTPGETGAEWWSATGHDRAYAAQRLEDESDEAVYLHDVAPELAEEMLRRGRDQSMTPMLEPWPLAAWPAVETRFLLCRDDRCFPADWLRGLVEERLGIVPDEIDGGHCPYLGRPAELADRLAAYARSAAGALP